jgi:hypothetical protein
MKPAARSLSDLLAYGPAPLVVKAAQALVDGLRTHADAEFVVGDLPRDAWYVRGLPCEGITVGAQEVNERAFLFGRELGPNPHGLGRVIGVDPDCLGLLGWVEGAGRGWLVVVGSGLHHCLMEPLELSGVGDGRGKLKVLATTGVLSDPGLRGCVYNIV